MKKRTILLWVLLLFFSCSPDFIIPKGYIGFFCTKKEIATEYYKSLNQFYGLKKNETIVSVGAEACCNEAIYELLSDSVNFIVENISSSEFFNQRQLDFAIAYYEKLFHKKNLSNYTLQIGNDTSTLLPCSIADKVLIENSFHEFSEPQKMLRDVYRILKPGGKLYLLEKISTPKESIDNGCGKALYFKDELIQLMREEKFYLLTFDIHESDENAGLFKFRKE